MPSRDLNAYDHLFQAAGEEYGIDPALLKAHSFVESGINVGTRASNQGAVGIMQMLPDTARGLGVKDPYDPAQAIRGAAKYIAEGFDKTGSAQDAVRYYHGGPDRRIWGPKTNAYVDKVSAAYDRFSREGMTPKQAAAAAPAAVQSASMSPEELVGLYGAGEGKPAASGGGEAPASGALAIRVKPNNPAGGMSPEDLVKLYGAGEGAQADAKPAVAPGDEAAAVGRGIINGVPILGPYLTTGTDMAVAGIRSLQSGKPFKEEYQTAKEFGRATAAANPGSTMGGEIAGNVLGLAPVAAAAPAAMGLSGNLLSRVLAGGWSGAGINALDAAARGEDVGRAATTGALLGSGTPMAAKAIGAAVGPAINKLTELTSNHLNPTTRASNQLLGAIEGADQTIPGLRAEFERNPNLAFADLNPIIQSNVVKAAQEGGPEAAALRTWVTGRRGAEGSMVKGALDSNLGGAIDPLALRDTLAATAKANAGKGFGDALNGAQPVDLNGLPNSTISKIHEAWNRVLAQFPDKTQIRFSQPEQMHLVQQQLRKEAETLGKSQVGTERLAADDIRNVRSQLVDRIDVASGGKFKPAQKQFADDMQVKEAFDTGMSALDRVRKGANGLEDRPEALARDWAAMSEPEKSAFRHGMRTQIETVMENARNPARAGEAITDPGFNQEKLAIVFGKDEARSLAKAVEDSRKMQTTNNLIDAGSKTAYATQGGKGRAIRGGSPVEDAATVITGAVGGAPGLAARYGLKAANSLTSNRLAAADVGRNRLVTDAGMAAGQQGQETLNKLEQFLAQRAAKKAGVSNMLSQSIPLNVTIRAAGNAGTRLLSVP